MSAYSDWQQSVDGPDEETLGDAMVELLTNYTVDELAAELGVSVSTVYRVIRTDKASGKTITAMNELANHLAGEWNHD